ncbi:uncharacterized protein EV422DRAFT_356033 [Fimicolochytrium jonesii]|uniref:uncharacterized protein n=1 Tax=Fimicolochytrium jonesii TaxID=1396493 RepID=UPI0022FEA34A|nr:uncharacterized protein EV422DRAFT_356033 [Fimicolochytrium jonesii]KAI8823454.1 hypothetical protein EV422DRAFT_356033 [Fimicolochytrium jonesii]
MRQSPISSIDVSSESDDDEIANSPGKAPQHGQIDQYSTDFEGSASVSASQAPDVLITSTEDEFDEEDEELSLDGSETEEEHGSGVVAGTVRSSDEDDEISLGEVVDGQVEKAAVDGRKHPLVVPDVSEKSLYMPERNTGVRASIGPEVLAVSSEPVLIFPGSWRDSHADAYSLEANKVSAVPAPAGSKEKPDVVPGIDDSLSEDDISHMLTEQSSIIEESMEESRGGQSDVDEEGSVPNVLLPRTTVAKSSDSETSLISESESGRSRSDDGAEAPSLRVSLPRTIVAEGSDIESSQSSAHDSRGGQSKSYAEVEASSPTASPPQTTVAEDSDLEPSETSGEDSEGAQNEFNGASSPSASPSRTSAAEQCGPDPTQRSTQNPKGGHSDVNVNASQPSLPNASPPRTPIAAESQIRDSQTSEHASPPSPYSEDFTSISLTQDEKNAEDAYSVDFESDNPLSESMLDGEMTPKQAQPQPDPSPGEDHGDPSSGSRMPGKSPSAGVEAEGINPLLVPSRDAQSDSEAKSSEDEVSLSDVDDESGCESASGEDVEAFMREIGGVRGEDLVDVGELEEEESADVEWDADDGHVAGLAMAEAEGGRETEVLQQPDTRKLAVADHPSDTMQQNASDAVSQQHPAEANSLPNPTHAHHHKPAEVPCARTTPSTTDTSELLPPPNTTHDLRSPPDTSSSSSAPPNVIVPVLRIRPEGAHKPPQEPKSPPIELLLSANEAVSRVTVDSSASYYLMTPSDGVSELGNEHSEDEENVVRIEMPSEETSDYVLDDPSDATDSIDVEIQTSQSLRSALFARLRQKVLHNTHPPPTSAPTKRSTHTPALATLCTRVDAHTRAAAARDPVVRPVPSKWVQRVRWKTLMKSMEEPMESGEEGDIFLVYPYRAYTGPRSYDTIPRTRARDAFKQEMLDRTPNLSHHSTSAYTVRYMPAYTSTHTPSYTANPRLQALFSKRTIDICEAMAEIEAGAPALDLDAYRAAIASS